MTDIAFNASPAAEASVKSEGPWRKAGRRFMRHKLAVAGLITLGVMVLLAVFAPWIGRYSPIELDLTAMNQAPSAAHWLGTDTTGRDVWSRVIHAGRVSLSVGLVAVSISTLIGIIEGSIAGYAAGKVDLLLMRITDMFMAFPSLVMIIAIASALGPSIYNTMLVIGILTWPGIARLVPGSGRIHAAHARVRQAPGRAFRVLSHQTSRGCWEAVVARLSIRSPTPEHHVSACLPASLASGRNRIALRL